MTRKERVLRTIRRQKIDYLPSNIFFASPETKLAFQKALGLGSLEALDVFLENHIRILSIRDDVCRHRGDHKFLRKAEKTIFAKIDWEKGGERRSHHPLPGTRSGSSRELFHGPE